MNIQNAQLQISAPNMKSYPVNNIPEIAFAGRSNVGKSSMINCLLNRKKLARTSSTPGKTVMINFYNIDEKLFLVDLPGYGYANVSKSEKKRFGEMMEEYMNRRQNLMQTILIVDARHKPTQDDVNMMNFIRYRHGKAIVVASKLDKLKKSEIEKNIEVIRKTLKLTEFDTFIPFSSQTGIGRMDIWRVISTVTGIELGENIDKI